MEDLDMEKAVGEVARLIMESEKIVVFTGAGVSTESGIPDFRSPGGIWEKFDPDDFTYQKFISSEESRRKSWMLSKEFYYSIANAEPNLAHLGIVEMERMGRLNCVITQNVDNLHQKAGNSPQKVIELHGTAIWVSCLNCGQRYPRDEIQQMLEDGVGVPKCGSCGGILKQATISFGQAMPQSETAEAERRSRESDLFIVVGSSLVVQPAALMPLFAKQANARLVIINISETPHDRYADIIIRGKAGEIFGRIMEKVRALSASD
jgi:NAD-dependent deacetylase